MGGQSKSRKFHEIWEVAGVEKAPKLKVKGMKEATAQLRRGSVRAQTLVVPPPVVQDVPAMAPEVPPPPVARPRMRAKTKDPMDPMFEENGLRRNVSSPIVHKLTDHFFI